jgi:drug/metabolite transporter (DMT)-like permease
MREWMNQTTFAMLIVVAFSVVGVVGDFFLKLASKHDPFYKSIWFYIGFAVYGSTALGWVFVMKHIKLATIGVVYSISMILLLTALGVVIFRESLSYYEIAGLLMAIGSLALLYRFA